MALYQRKTLSWVLGDISAGTGRTIYVYRAQRKEKVRAAYVEASTTVAKNAADYVLISLKVGSDTVASLSTAGSSGNAITAGTAAAMTITAANDVLDAGDVLAIVIAHTGSTGQALDEPTVQVDLDPIE